MGEPHTLRRSRSGSGPGPNHEDCYRDHRVAWGGYCVLEVMEAVGLLHHLHLMILLLARLLITFVAVATLPSVIHCYIPRRRYK